MIVLQPIYWSLGFILKTKNYHLLFVHILTYASQSDLHNAERWVFITYTHTHTFYMYTHVYVCAEIERLIDSFIHSFINICG